MNNSQKETTVHELLRMKMLKILAGGWLSQCIYLVAKLGIADYFNGSQLSMVELSFQCNLDHKLLYRIMTALASRNIFIEYDDKVFGHSELSQLLTTDNQYTLKNLAILYGESHYQAWGEILNVVKTGSSGFELKYGEGVFEYLNKHPEEADCFHRSMSEKAKLPIQSILKHYSFSDVNTIVDIGGGDGSLLLALLEQYSKMQGVIFDLPVIREKAEKEILEKKLFNRCTFSGGNFFDIVPKGANVYLMKSILHDWHDNEAVKILQTCSQAMLSSSKLLIIEAIPSGRNTFDYAKMLDIQMLVNTHGRERSTDEFRELCYAASLKLLNIIPTSTEFSILECECM